MDRQETYALAKKLHTEGKSYAEIAEVLAEKGVKSVKTGKPLTVGGIHALLVTSVLAKAKSRPQRKATRGAARRTSEKPQRRTGDRSMLEIVDRLLGNERMDVSDRVAASKMLIESHLKSR